MEAPGPLVEHPRTGLHKPASGLKPEEVGLGGTLFLCRHAEVHNPRGILYGRLPRFGLTSFGREQAAQLGDFLARQDLFEIYSSPLLRARQTAQVIQARFPRLKLRTDRNLLEVETGYDGCPLSEIGEFNFYEPLARPDDETIVMVRDRVLKFVEQTLKRHPGRKIAAVSHGDPVTILHAYYLGLPMQLASLRAPNFYSERASVSRYDFPPEGFTRNIERVQVSYFEPPFSEDAGRIL
jgi:broad specificity phosphatase PhoE